MISIVVPVYNSVATLKRALDSVQAQTFSDWELIVVDDASSDGTVKLAKQLYSSDNRFRFILKEVNTGPAESRNLGFDQARGEWIALLDADDSWLPNRLAELLSASSDSDLIADNLMTYDVSIRRETGPYYKDFSTPVLTLADYLIGWLGNTELDGGYLKPLLRTSFLRTHNLRYDCALRHGEDYLLYCKALCWGARFKLINSCNYIYTTPIGWYSKEKSVHTRTIPDPIALAKAMQHFRTEICDRLCARDKDLYDRKIAELYATENWWAFEGAWRAKNYFLCLYLLRYSAVRKGFWVVLLSKLNLYTPTRPR